MTQIEQKAELKESLEKSMNLADYRGSSCDINEHTDTLVEMNVHERQYIVTFSRPCNLTVPYPR